MHKAIGTCGMVLVVPFVLLIQVVWLVPALTLVIMANVLEIRRAFYAYKRSRFEKRPMKAWYDRVIEGQDYMVFLFILLMPVGLWIWLSPYNDLLD